MPDNVEITAGSGTPVATDDVGGNQYQRMKLTDGTPDSAVHLVVEEVASGSGRGSLWASLVDIQVSLRNLFNAVTRPIWMNPVTGLIRTESISGTLTTVATVTTVTTLTSLNQLNGLAIKDVMIDQMMRTNWAQNVRPRIT